MYKWWLGSAVIEYLNDNDINIKVKRLALKEKYYFQNGGREFLLDNNNLSKNLITAKILIINNKYGKSSYYWRSRIHRFYFNEKTFGQKINVTVLDSLIYNQNSPMIAVYILILLTVIFVIILL